MKRHAAEIFTSVIISTLFSLYSTALIGRLVGLEPALTISVIPRCITVALALSIVSLFEGLLLSIFLELGVQLFQLSFEHSLEGVLQSFFRRKAKDMRGKFGCLSSILFPPKIEKGRREIFFKFNFLKFPCLSSQTREIGRKETTFPLKLGSSH